MKNSEVDLIITQLTRIEKKQDITEEKMETFNLKLHDIIKTCEIVLPEEEIRKLAKDEINKAGPFNLGLSKKQIGLFITFLGGVLTAIATFINTIIK